MKKINELKLNVVSTLILQVVTIICGFIVPRQILLVFGSEVNGLVSSLNQLLNYIELLEGGVTSVIMASLYKPLVDNDIDKISSIVKTTNSFFKKISYVFLLYTVGLAIIYPLVTNTDFSFLYIFSLTFILSIKLFVQYNLSLTLKNLLNADKKMYIVSLTQILLIIVDTFIFCVVIRFYKNIHILKLLSGLIFIIQPIVFNKFIKKYFRIDKNAPINNNLIKSRWDGFAINLSAFIHNNTDITLLTVFCNLSMVSVYSVYSMVCYGIKKIIMSISSGIQPSLGHVYAKNDNKQLKEKFDNYELLYFVIIFILFGVTGLLINDFVIIYTKGINDIDYYQPIFGFLLILSEAIYVLRIPYQHMANVANKFKDMKKHAIIETIINIVLSLILVKRYNLIGIAIGTLVAMIYRTLYHVIYLSKNIINRPIVYFIKKILLFIGGLLFGIFICKKVIPVFELSVLTWILNSIIYMTVLTFIYIIISYVFFKKEFKYIIQYVKGGNKNER